MHPQSHAPQTKLAHLKDLALLFAVPLAVVLTAFAVVYLPRLAAKPGYDFIYITCSTYSGCNKDYYTVDASGTLKTSTVKALDATKYATLYDINQIPTLRYYDAKANATRALSLEEARGLKLSGLSKSPDGYTLQYQDETSGFLFWDSSGSGWRLKNGVKQKAITLDGSKRYYSENTSLVGWVL